MGHIWPIQASTWVMTKEIRPAEESTKKRIAYLIRIEVLFALNLKQLCQSKHSKVPRSIIFE